MCSFIHILDSYPEGGLLPSKSPSLHGSFHSYCRILSYSEVIPIWIFAQGVISDIFWRSFLYDYSYYFVLRLLSYLSWNPPMYQPINAMHFFCTASLQVCFHLSPTVLNWECGCMVGLRPSPPIIKYQICIWVLLRCERGLKWIPWGCTHQTNRWKHVQTYGSVDVRHVSGDDGHLCLHLFQLVHIR
jgi:hypothetical protein